MTLIEALTILSVHNSWRHGDEGAPETHPASLTQAIDLVGEKVPQMIYALQASREALAHYRYGASNGPEPAKHALDCVIAALGEAK